MHVLLADAGSFDVLPSSAAVQLEAAKSPQKKRVDYGMSRLGADAHIRFKGSKTCTQQKPISNPATTAFQLRVIPQPHCVPAWSPLSPSSPPISELGPDLKIRYGNRSTTRTAPPSSSPRSCESWSLRARCRGKRREVSFQQQYPPPRRFLVRTSIAVQGAVPSSARCYICFASSSSNQQSMCNFRAVGVSAKEK